MTPSDRAHQALAIFAAVMLAASGSATAIAGIIMAFGGHVSAVNITGWTAAGSAAALVFSKLIDSANNAWVSRQPPPVVTPSTAAPSDTTTATVQALGRYLAGYGQTSLPPL
jgi:hypothetical protein